MRSWGAGPSGDGRLGLCNLAMGRDQGEGAKSLFVAHSADLSGQNFPRLRAERDIRNPLWRRAAATPAQRHRDSVDFRDSRPFTWIELIRSVESRRQQSAPLRWADHGAFRHLLFQPS
jgi:hypothetical protein